MEKHWYVLSCGNELSGKPVAMTADELASAQEHAETHSGGNWWWVRYDPTDDDMRYAVMSEYHNEY